MYTPEALVIAARTQRVALGRETLDQLADLVLRLADDAARRAGAVLTPMQLRTYAERSDTERDGMRSAVVHVIKALVLLEVIELPS